jgi:hypothetical protein
MGEQFPPFDFGNDEQLQGCSVPKGQMVVLIKNAALHEMRNENMKK